MPDICRLDGCASPVYLKRDSLCRAHYYRLRRHGDPEAGGPRRVDPAPPRVRKALDHGDGTRTCLDCGERKPLDQFPKDKNATLGHRTNCRPCHSARARAWYEKNREEHLPRQRARYERDIDKMRQRDKERYERDKPKRIAYAVDQVHRRRAALASVPFEKGITVLRLRSRLGDRCHYCRAVMTFTPGDGHTYVPLKATLEHVLPLSRGGGHTWENVVLACWQCNVRKNRRLADEWIPVLADSADGDEQLFLWSA